MISFIAFVLLAVLVGSFYLPYGYDVLVVDPINRTALLRHRMFRFKRAAFGVALDSRRSSSGLQNVNWRWAHNTRTVGHFLDYFLDEQYHLNDQDREAREIARGLK